MAVTAIKDFKIKEAYTKLVEKALFSYLWEGIYKPMFQIMSIKPPKAINSISTIITAIRNGSIIYENGLFIAKKKFTIAQYVELEKWGAKWDSRAKGYRLPEDKLPDNIKVTIAEAKINAQMKIDALVEFLNEVEKNMPYIVDSMIFDDEVKTILDDAGNEIKKNTKHLAVIEPKLTEQQKNEIAQTYTENVRGYAIKDFANERIPEMRQKIQELVLKGYRTDKVQELLEKEYGFMAKKAKFLAQNETAIMLAEYKKVTYQEMGFHKFMWSTILDGRERERHKELNGKIFSYDDPPFVDAGKTRKGLPGEDYNCRCEAIPISETHYLNRKKK